MTRDAWVGVAILGIAALYWLGADAIRISPLDGPVGAQGLPKSLAYALAILAVLLILRSLAVGRGKAAKREEPQEPTDTAGLRPRLRALGMLALGVAYLLIVPYLGYVLSIMGLLLAVSLYVDAGLDGDARLGRKALLFAGVGGVFFYLLFVQLLNIPLPPGSIWAGLLRSIQG